jgi:hypothetical protein
MGRIKTIGDKIILYVFLLFLLPSCLPAKYPVQISGQIENREQIIFLTFKISQPKVEEYEEIVLIEKKIREGKLKVDSNLIDELHEGNLLCSYLDDNDMVIQQVLIENPLNRRMEYFDDNGKPHQKIVSLDSATFFLRTQFLNVKKSLKIQKVLVGHKTEVIFKMDL